ncbi:hypothetical protein [Collimonas arenae]|uniref:hypothetical protein n=1 Tax=Collimonas arenae TaxID=279058 RepID=UPI00056E6DDB|nr:hypothetical protein [Collimonas arenae]
MVKIFSAIKFSDQSFPSLYRPSENLFPTLFFDLKFLAASRMSFRFRTIRHSSHSILFRLTITQRLKANCQARSFTQCINREVAIHLQDEWLQRAGIYTADADTGAGDEWVFGDCQRASSATSTQLCNM